jgi:hypothetical protein
LATEGDTPLIAEILPNVREIGHCLIDLEPLIEEPGLRAAVTTQRQFCLLVQQIFSDVCAKNPIDTAKVAAAAVQQMMGARRVINYALVEKTKKRPRRRRRPGDDEMDADEFFRRFELIKGAAAAAARSRRSGQPHRLTDLPVIKLTLHSSRRVVVKCK